MINLEKKCATGVFFGIEQFLRLDIKRKKISKFKILTTSILYFLFSLAVISQFGLNFFTTTNIFVPLETSFDAVMIVYRVYN